VPAVAVTHDRTKARLRGRSARRDDARRHRRPDDGDLSAPGASGNLLCGEGFVSPVGGQGTIAASSLPAGLVGEPVLLTDDGRLARAEGEGATAFLAELDACGPLGRSLAELGVGVNDRATLTGNGLEDEKILGTAHVALGASAGMTVPSTWTSSCSLRACGSARPRSSTPDATCSGDRQTVR
jgi:leucyl aminopeptidase (aminopeptidase T)